MAGKNSTTGRKADTGFVALRTKVTPPGMSPHHASRRRAVERLSSSDSPLTVLSAPAGFGKSSLLTEWAAERSRAVGWLRIDRGDNDPAVLARYLVASVAMVAPDATEAAVGAATAGAPPGVVMKSLAAGVEGAAIPITTVIDDFHHLSHPDVLELCASALDALPDTWRWVILSRREPQLGLARRRIDESLNEVPIDDMRFADDEASALIREGMGVKASPGAVRELNRRARGWAAGLVMAGLAARDASDPDATLLRYSGRDLHLGQYFAEEVFALLPLRLQAFLLETSVLHVLDPDLCFHVTGTSDVVQMLAEASSRRLFLVPLGPGDTEAFHYHDLFTEWLVSELDRRAPGRSSELRRRAAAWCADRSLEAEAIRYSLEAGDWERGCELIRACGYEMLQRGFYRSVLAWLRALPEAVLDVAPDLAALAGDASIQSGELDLVARFADLALAADDSTPEGLAARLGGLSLVWLTSLLAGPFADNQAAAAEIERLVASPGAGDPASRISPDFGRLLGQAALTRYLAGDAASQISPLLERSREFATSVFSQLLCDGIEALLLVEAHREEEGAALIRADLGGLEDVDKAPVGVIVALMALLWAGADDEAAVAAAHLRNVVERLGLPAGPAVVALTEAELANRSERYGQAAAAVAEARRLLGEMQHPAPIGRWLDIQSGRVLPPDTAIDPSDFTDRERQVLRYLPTRLTRREIAAEIGLSVDTVKTHITKLYRKLGVSGRAEAVARARRFGLLS